MSVSGVVSSPVLQWLQSYFSKSGPATGIQSCYGCQSSSDTTSISHIHNPKDLTRLFFLDTEGLGSGISRENECRMSSILDKLESHRLPSECFKSAQY